MTYLKFYSEERKEFEAQAKTTIADKNVSKFAHKIARHFKVKLSHITLRCYSGSGSASRVYDSIRLSHNPSVLLIIHEIGHIYTRQKLGEQKHNKKLMGFIRRAVHYAEKNQYWSLTQTETEKQLEKTERKQKETNKKSLRAFTKCGLCGFVSDWNLSEGYKNYSAIHWAKERYALNTVHEVTCYRCKLRSSQTVIEISYMTRTEKSEFLEKHNSLSVFPLAVSPVSERSLVLYERRTEIKLYAIPLGA